MGVGKPFANEFASVQRKQVEQLKQRQDNHERLQCFQSLAAAIAGVNLLGSEAHGQKSEQPRDQRSGSSGCKALRTPDAGMVSSSQGGCDTDHARYQCNRDKNNRGNIADLVACSGLVSIQVAVQDGSSQASGDEVQAEVEEYERGQQDSANAERHCRKLFSNK